MKLSKHANEDKNINKEQLESNKRRIELHISEIISGINNFHMWISKHGKYHEMERVYTVYNSIGTLARILKEKIDELNFEPKTANRKTLSKWAEEFEKKMENDYPEELEELRGPDEYDDVQWPSAKEELKRFFKEKPKPTKLNYPLSEEEKWTTFDKYVKIFEEDPNISKNQLYDLKLALEKTIWDK